MPGQETLGRISLEYSKPASHPRRHVEHDYSEIGPPELPPRGYKDEYMAQGETLPDDEIDFANASSFINV